MKNRSIIQLLYLLEENVRDLSHDDRKFKIYGLCAVINYMNINSTITIEEYKILHQYLLVNLPPKQPDSLYRWEKHDVGARLTWVEKQIARQEFIENRITNLA